MRIRGSVRFCMMNCGAEVPHSLAVNITNCSENGLRVLELYQSKFVGVMFSHHRDVYVVYVPMRPE